MGSSCNRPGGVSALLAIRTERIRHFDRPGALGIGEFADFRCTTVVRLVRWLIRGGSEGNEQLTAIVAALLILLFAAEGATLLNVRGLLSVHAFVGMLLVPLIVLKLATVGWKMLRYYLHGEEYVRRGPPHVFIRTLLAPVTVVSTVVLFATGVALLALDQTQGTLVGLHKASFVVWFGSMSLHVLTRGWKLPGTIRARVPGAALRVGLAGSMLVAGVALATLTLPAADHLQDGVSAQIGLDAS